MALKLIGAGPGRTGTASLKVALETLGLGRCYHMGEVVNDMSSVEHWVAAAKGNPDRDRIFDGYGAAVDYMAAIAPERLLVYEVKQGWEPLCEFLDVPVPDEPFPRVNSRSETTAMLDAMIASSADGDLQAELRDRSKELFENSQ